MAPRFLLLAFVLLGGSVFAQDPAPPANAASKLTVLVKPVKPFAFDQGGQLTGYSIDLWKRVALETGMVFDYKPVPDVPSVIGGLKKGEADVGVGALSITAEREALVDFSYPYYKSGLQILAAGAGDKSPFRAFLRLDIFKILGLLLIAIAINSHILWFFEKKRNPESFPENYFEGIMNAAWWSVCILVTLGCENIAPARVVGRLLGVVWMLAGVALYSYVTATLTTTMTKDALQSDIKSVRDLAGLDVGTVNGSSSARFLDREKIVFKGFPDVESACQALNTGVLKAVVYDAPLLKYYLNKNADSKLQLVGDLLEKQDYGFALREKSTLRKEINRALLKLAEEGFLDELDKKWFAPAE